MSDVLAPLIPINLNLVDRNLYLGNVSAAIDIKTLKKHKITHILTINDLPLPKHIQNLEKITKKYIQLVDRPQSDILSYFDDTYDFITEGVSQGVVLVHSFFGASRSAAIVIAYLMKTYNLTPQKALDKVKKRGNEIHLDSFMCQLNLYHQKECKIEEEVYYCCISCDQVLATQMNVITHKMEGKLCTKIYFLQRLDWMNRDLSRNKELSCPCCSAEVGAYNWFGHMCACGYKQNKAFYLNSSAINIYTVRKGK